MELSPDILQLLQSLTSVWALELLIFLIRHPDQVWTVDALVRELRGSRPLVVDVVGLLERLGLVETSAHGAWRYRPASAELAERAAEIERIYGERPLMLVNVILTTPNSKIRIFSDAFKWKKD